MRSFISSSMSVMLSRCRARDASGLCYAGRKKSGKSCRCLGLKIGMGVSGQEMRLPVAPVASVLDKYVVLGEEQHVASSYHPKVSRQV